MDTNEGKSRVSVFEALRMLHRDGTSKEKPSLASHCVSEIMTREVVCLFPYQLYFEALAILARSIFSHFPVIDQEARLLGVLSARDFLRTWTHNLYPERMTVQDMIRQEALRTVSVDTRVSVALEVMLNCQADCLSVVDEAGRLCGIVTARDFLRLSDWP